MARMPLCESIRWLVSAVLSGKAPAPGTDVEISGGGAVGSGAGVPLTPSGRTSTMCVSLSNSAPHLSREVWIVPILLPSASYPEQPIPTRPRSTSLLRLNSHFTSLSE